MISEEDLARVALETGESIEIVRSVADAMAACAEEEDLEEMYGGTE